MDVVSGWLSFSLARYLSAEVNLHSSAPLPHGELLRASLRPSNVLLLKRHSRLSTAIKHRTQSKWSHAALYVGLSSERNDCAAPPLLCKNLHNVFNLARCRRPTPPVPQRLLSLNSDDLTHAICSALIALAFQPIRCLILPVVDKLNRDALDGPAYFDEILRLRHNSLFAPRNFDVLP